MTTDVKFFNHVFAVTVTLWGLSNKQCLFHCFCREKIQIQCSSADSSDDTFVTNFLVSVILNESYLKQNSSSSDLLSNNKLLGGQLYSRSNHEHVVYCVSDLSAYN